MPDAADSANSANPDTDSVLTDDCLLTDDLEDPIAAVVAVAVSR